MFTAQLGQHPAPKGNMTYTDGYGSYTADVTGLVVSGQDATITGDVHVRRATPYATVGNSSPRGSFTT